MLHTTRFVGIDLHRNYCSISILTHDGVQVHSQTIKNTDTSSFLTLFSDQSLLFTVVIESTYGWYWLSDLLDTLKNVTVHIAHALQVKKMSIAGKKTDKVDATLLANLARIDMLPESHKTSKLMREAKEILRTRSYFVKQRSSLKTKLRDLLAKQNLTCPADDIASKKAIDWINQHVTTFPYSISSQSLLDSIKQLSATIAPFDKQIREYVQLLPDAKLLMTIPGIGVITATTLLAEIDGIKRFGSADKLCSYAGLVPSVSSSGGKTYYGRLRDGNTYIKSVLGEASMVAIRKDEWLRMKYDALKKKKHARAAKVMVMRKLLISVYHVLTKQEAYKPQVINDSKQA